MRVDRLPQDDDPAYREFLLSIEDNFFRASDVEFDPPDQIRQRTIQNLRQVFKQDFTTQDNALVPATRVAIEVLSAALTEDFGASPGDVPTQGPGVSDTDFLRSLIQLSQRSAQQLSAQFRLDFSRPEEEQTTRVHENILTLQSHFREDTSFGPRANPSKLGNPFFLYKEEWRIRFQDGFSPENHYAFKTGLLGSDGDRAAARKLLDDITRRQEFQQDSEDFRRFAARADGLLQADARLMDGHLNFIIEEFLLAKRAYEDAEILIRSVVAQMVMFLKHGDTNISFTLVPQLFDPDGFRQSLDPNKVPGAEGAISQNGDPIDIPNRVIPSSFPYTALLFDQISARYDGRASQSVKSPDELNALESRNTVNGFTFPKDGALYSALKSSLIQLHDQLVSLIPHAIFLLLPVSKADVAAASGDFVTAAFEYGQVVRERLERGSLNSRTPFFQDTSGDLPWSFTDNPGTLSGADYVFLNQDCEGRMMLLRANDLYLAWADQLYRSDQEADVFRARELFKAVLRLSGANPRPGPGINSLPVSSNQSAIVVLDGTGNLVGGGRSTSLTSIAASGGPSVVALARTATVVTAELDPAWSAVIAAQLDPLAFSNPLDIAPESGINGVFFHPVPLPVNPALLAQQTRAQAGLTQIDSGLNVYGFADGLVPLLRYRPLASAAEQFAALARQTEADYISFKERAENGELGLVEARSNAAIAALRVQVEGQRIVEAQGLLLQAGLQVQQLQDVIDAKQQEIDDHNSLCGEMKDFFGGILSFLSASPPSVPNFITKDFDNAFSKVGNATEIPGVGITSGIGLFFIASVSALQSMTDAANARTTDLRRLQNQKAQAQLAVDARTHELAIAQLQNGIAVLEATRAQEILRFNVLRTLNFEVWGQLASGMKRILRRYLDLAASLAWLAERALSYEQNRDIRIIRFDYFQAKSQGLLSAEALQVDIARLEDERLLGFQRTQPIQFTISLMRDFPLQFGQLKATGRCSFATTSEALNRAYPGSYGHRIRSVELATVVPVAGQAPRGTLLNLGVSEVEDEVLGAGHVLVRPPDVCFLSEFTLKDGLAIYDLPGESLMALEGSGIDTSWILELPTAANAAALATLADVLITLRLQAQFSVARRQQVLRQAVTISRSLLIPAKALFPDGFASFVSGGSDRLEFAVTANLLPGAETNRQVTNVSMFFATERPPQIRATLRSTAVPAGTGFVTDAGLAHSNRLTEPALSLIAPPPSSLDALAAGPPDQTWTLEVPASDNANLQRAAIREIILGIEYTAQAG